MVGVNIPDWKDYCDDEYTNKYLTNDKIWLHYNKLIERYPELSIVKEYILKSFLLLAECYCKKGQLLICGNGGSASDSDHIVGELMKGFQKPRKLEGINREKYKEYADRLQEVLPAISLTQHVALSTAYMNDVDHEMVFAQQVYGYGRLGDVFLGITTSGNSMNVFNAAKVAKYKGIKVVGLTGADGGKLKEISDVCINIPKTITAEVQEVHLPIYHTLCAMLEEMFF
jgi:D-sedoheptulose 7-phosphate isomerase